MVVADVGDIWEPGFTRFNVSWDDLQDDYKWVNATIVIIYE